MKVVHLARKPLGKMSLVECVLKHGTGAINIAATRISPQGEEGGRWPSNVIFHHRPTCRCVGLKKAKGTSIHGSSTEVRRAGTHSEAGGSHTVGRVQPVNGYSDAEGMETIEDWECAEDCPVLELDQLTGSGRFYKQVTNTDQMVDYFKTLISSALEDDEPIDATQWPDKIEWDRYGDETISGVLLQGDPTPYIEDLLRILKPGAHVVLFPPKDDPLNIDGACLMEQEGLDIRNGFLIVMEPGRHHYMAKAGLKERHAGCEHLKVTDEDVDLDDPNTYKGNEHPCLHPGALVMTEMGYRPISEIQVGQRVYTQSGEFHPVVACTLHPYTSSHLYEIEVAGTNYKTLSTDNHPFLIWRPSRSGKGNITGGVVQWVQAENIRKGDYTMTPLLAQSPGLQESKPPRPSDTRFWFLFGLYLAEGVLQQAGHGSNIYPSYTLHENETSLITRIESYSNCNTSVYPKKEGASVQVICFDPELGHLFHKLGGHGAGEKHLHPMIWNLPPESRTALLEGYLAGDGGDVRTYKQAKTVSPDLASQIRLLGESCGYKANLFYYDAEPGSIGDRHFHTTQPYYQIRLYSENQKHAKVGTRKPSRPTLLEHGDQTFMLRYVQKVRTVPYQGDVVNLSVAECPTFQTAVGMSHNTVKPRDLLAKLAEDVPEGGTILDPFMGSGSMGLACLMTGHSYVGIELEESYLEIADTRIRYWDRAECGWSGPTIESDAPGLTQEHEDVDIFDI